MAYLPIGIAGSTLLLLAPLTAFGQGQKPCEKFYEDAQILIARCTFPPGSKHVLLSQPGYFSYVLSGGKSQTEDANGTRQIEHLTGSHKNNPPISWQELTNVGDTALSFLVIERKYDQVPAVERASDR
jgi:hypothetical protein